MVRIKRDEARKEQSNMTCRAPCQGTLDRKLPTYQEDSQPVMFATYHFSRRTEKKIISSSMVGREKRGN